MTLFTIRHPTRLLRICAGLLLLMALPLQAAVVARLSSDTTSLEQPVQLTLESQGEQSGSPDLSPLEADFEILGRATQQSISVINGNIASRRSLILTLLPRRQGKLSVPAIAFGEEKTSPLTLEVTDQPSDQPATTSRQAAVELSLNKASAYPEEEVILTLKLFQGPAVRGESLDQPAPSFGDTRLQLLDESEYTAERNGQPYRVLERSYGLYAYQTGKLEIPPVVFRGRSGGGSIFGLLDDPFGSPAKPSRMVIAKSNPLSLEIKPIPAQFTGRHWLPAKQIQLVDTGIDEGTAVVTGKPVTRRIMLIADGLLSSQLPAIEQQVPDGIKPYEERPQLQDTPRRSGVSSSRENVITLIPTRAGRFTLPAIEIPWWNTTTGKQEVAKLPSLTLDVAPGAASDTPPVAPAQPAQTTAQPMAEARGQPETPTPAATESGGLHWLIGLLGAAWLATLAGWWYSHRRQHPKTPPPPLQEQSPKTEDEGLSSAIEALTAAYEGADPEAARRAWLRWGECRWPQNPPHNLTRLAGRCDAPIAEAVISLERTLYSPGVESGWAEMLDPAQLRDSEKPNAPARVMDEQLLPLNP